jgi:hypothetical protein
MQQQMFAATLLASAALSSVSGKRVANAHPNVPKPHQWLTFTNCPGLPCFVCDRVAPSCTGALAAAGRQLTWFCHW